MKNLFQEENILFDGASIYPDFEKLNEYHYLKELFHQLKKQINHFSDYEFVIFCGDNRILPESLGIPNPNNKKRVLLYLSDETGYVPTTFSNKYYKIFKIHLKREYSEYNIFPFPLGYASGVEELPYIKPSDREYSCFFSGNLNPGRERFWFHFLNPIERFVLKLQIGQLRLSNIYTKRILLRFKHFSEFDKKYNNSIIRFTSKFGTGYDKNEYSALLQKSRIAICPKGFFTTECFRHYEAMRAGCIIISEPLPKTYFYANSPIIEISDWSDLNDIIEELENSPELQNKLSIASKEWYNSHMSEEAIATYMTNILKG